MRIAPRSTTSKPLFVLAFALFGMCGPLLADQPISPPVPVNSYAGTETSQDQAAGVATDGQGHWIAVWDSNYSVGGVTGNDGDIIYSVSTDNGATWSAAAALNSDAPSDSTNDFSPIIASDGHGRWVAVWHADPGGYHLRYAVSDNNGATWSAAADLTPFHGNDDENPRLATDGNGNWIAVWDSTHSIGGTTGGDGDIHFAVSTDNGTTWTTAAALNTTAATDANGARDWTPTIATDAQGHWVVVWAFRDYTNGTLGNDFDLLYAVSSNNGATWSAPVPLNADAATDTSNESSPGLATDRSGHWMVVWQSNNSLGGTIGTDDDVLFATSTDNGATWSAAAPVNSDATTDSVSDGNPILTADGNGHWVVIWGSTGRSFGTDEDFVYAVSSNVGAAWTAPAAFNTNAATDSGQDRLPAAATDERGHWVGCWNSTDSLGGTIGTDSDILAATLIFPDCNNNGVSDSDDITSGTSADCDGNGVPDECQNDTDGDGVIDACDGCPSDPAKSAAGFCGCGNPETDTDGDGTPDCVDGCPNDAAKTAPGACGCGTPDTDTDGDGTPDCNDGCPNDPAKTEPGTCGCGTPDTDSDGDGTPDCIDGCPNDAGKTEPGVCGCGTPDADTDGDGVLDCDDGCPNDPAKTEPGACGCGTPDTDTDGDGVPDCIDNCPEIANTDQADADGDGVGDACVSDLSGSTPDPCGAGACGAGMAAMLPLMLCQLCLLRAGWHRRRRSNRGR